MRKWQRFEDDVTETQLSNRLYEFTLKVVHGRGTCNLPEGMTGAYVTCYGCAPDPEIAMRKGVATIVGMGLVFADIKEGVREIPVESWTSYVAKVWPDFSAHLPSEDDLASMMCHGGVFFGPFIGFSSS